MILRANIRKLYLEVFPRAGKPNSRKQPQTFCVLFLPYSYGDRGVYKVVIIPQCLWILTSASATLRKFPLPSVNPLTTNDTIWHHNSSTCFRHKSAKMWWNKAILKNSKNLVSFCCALSLNVQLHTFVAFVHFSQHFMKTRWLPKKFLHFLALARQENTFLHIRHSLRNIQHSPWPLPCVCVSQQQGQSIKFQKKFGNVAALLWLHSRNGWGILNVLGVGKCCYPTGKRTSVWEQ